MKRGRVGAAAALIAAAVVMCAAFAGAFLGPQPGDDDYRLGLDYPAFYGAGDIALDGDLTSLYVPDRQQRAQEPVIADGLMYFAYPQPVALAYAPFAALPPKAGYLLHTAVMLAALLLAVQLIRPLVPWVDRRPGEASALALLFVPMAQAVTLGQNTAMSLLLAILVWRSLRAGRDEWAGVALAFSCFKPQLGLPLLLLVALSRRFRAIGTALATGAVVYAATIPFAGVSWPLDWLRWARWYNSIESVDGAKHVVSYTGFATSVLGPGTAATIVGSVLGLAVAVLLVLMWWRRSPGLDRRMAATLVLLVLASPHAVSHDSALALPALALIAGWCGRSRRWIPVSMLAVVVLQGLSGQLGFSIATVPLTVIALLTLRPELIDRLPASDEGSPATDPVRVTA